MVHWKQHYLNLAEPFRCASEYKRFRQSQEALLKDTPAGDNHPVLVLPGFGADDWFTAPLRDVLKKKGYRTYRWKGGPNLGMKEETAQHLYERLKEVYEKNGHQKVSLIGHSLGGLYARALAREFPHMVRDVITVGTPFGIGMNIEETPLLIREAIQRLSEDRYSLKNKDMGDRLLTPPPDVPTTSIFSKTDGIGGWEACLNPATPLSENIEVVSSHTGMVWNTDALTVILDRLSQKEGQWKKYKEASPEVAPHNPNWQPKSTDWSFFPKP